MSYKKKCKELKKKLKKAKGRLKFSEASIDLLRETCLAKPKKSKDVIDVFVGKILSINGDVVLQKIGRKTSETYSHSLKSLDVEPKVGIVVSITYNENGMGKVEPPKSLGRAD